MRPNCCHISLAFVLKFFNFLQAFIGVSIIVYSVWMLNQWNDHVPISPPPPLPPSAPSPASSLSLFLSSEPARVSNHIPTVDLPSDMVSGFDGGFGLEVDLNSFQLPAPWFIYSFMGVGVLLCCITLIGCIAAEVIHGCCLCFYTVLITVLILLEAALVAFIAIDRHWEQDLPFDPTGELESLRSFIEVNIDICKWVGIAVVVIQALSLLLSIILRAMVSTRRTDLDCEDDYDGRGRGWEPLLNSQPSQPVGSNKGDVRGAHSDIWSSRIREKYGLSTNQNASVSTNSRQ
ncbi:tetraspanin-18-like [Corylus avellana]|uniref:tetraspanin-18-like n=1 Tax=Corylus avellana TaxID=13451 RepID=UPI00286B0DB9|nr:tetraspanin-18-like [Corylus avellana]